MTEPTEAIRQKYEALQGFLNESTRRRWAATEARALGRGGIAKVARATGLNPSTIRVGLSELDNASPSPAREPGRSRGDVGAKSGSRTDTSRVRAPGGGRKPVTATDPTLLSDLDALLEPPLSERDASPLQWTCQSTRELARGLAANGHRISQQKVAELLRDLGFSLRAPHTRQAGPDYPPCDLQIRHVCAGIRGFHTAGQPVIAIATRTGIAVGSESLRPGNPANRTEPGPDSGTAVGPEQDLPLFAGQSMRLWWGTMGKIVYPEARQLLVAAACGGGLRARLQWKLELQAFANATGLVVRVRHLPPGTRKWRGVQHYLLSHSTQAWLDRPQVSCEVMVSLLAPAMPPGSTQETPAPVVDPPQRISRAHTPAHRALRITPDEFFGEWNYDITPL